MGEQISDFKLNAIRTPDREHPNLPEVSGTTFPLLTTLLAGFAVTIAVQLMIRPDTGVELATREFAALAAFLASTLLFISSIVFSVNAQAHNYLPFIGTGTDGQRVFGVSDPLQWISLLHRRWEALHIAAIVSFYGGLLLLLAGVNLVVWIYVGDFAAAGFLMLVLFNLALTTAVTMFVNRMRLPATVATKSSEVRTNRGERGALVTIKRIDT